MKEETEKRKKLSSQEALIKAQAYCVYQERCHSEVRNKLYEWGLWSKDVELIIAQLITDNFINEERFAKAFAGGKFRIKKWGRRKIITGLKQKNISEYCINKALQEIDNRDYIQVLKELLKKKAKEIKEKNQIRFKAKLVSYAISKGFESDIVWDIINNME